MPHMPQDLRHCGSQFSPLSRGFWGWNSSCQISEDGFYPRAISLASVFNFSSFLKLLYIVNFHFNRHMRPIYSYCYIALSIVNLKKLANKLINKILNMKGTFKDKSHIWVSLQDC